MSDCNCGHPNCSDCYPLNNKHYCYQCKEYVWDKTGCKHSIERYIEEEEKHIEYLIEELKQFKKKYK
jgi:hypothetical protein